MGTVGELWGVALPCPHPSQSVLSRLEGPDDVPSRIARVFWAWCQTGWPRLLAPTPRWGFPWGQVMDVGVPLSPQPVQWLHASQLEIGVGSKLRPA